MAEALYLEREERVILGHALNFADKQAEFLEGATEEMFFLDGHKRILRAMCRLRDRGAGVDFASLQTELMNSAELSAAGGAAYIAELTEGTIRTYEMRHHLATLREMAAKRSLATKLEHAANSLYANVASDDVIAALERDVAEVQSGHDVEVFSLNDFLQTELDAIGAERKSQSGTIGIPTGIAGLDAATTGWRPEYTIVGAWPARGKTSFLLQGALTAALAGYPALIISLEMRKSELMRRLMSITSQMRPRKFRDPRTMNDAEYGHVINSSESLTRLPIYICDQDSMDPRQITATARLWIRKAGVKIVFVDFIQIVRESGRDAREVTNKISAGLRSLAKNAGVPVIAASQLSRANARNLNERPTLFHLKESGNLEQDAHNVLLLYRPVDEQQEFTGEDEIIIAKQRHGITGPIKVRYDSNRLVFEERKELKGAHYGG